MSSHSKFKHTMSSGFSALSRLFSDDLPAVIPHPVLVAPYPAPVETYIDLTPDPATVAPSPVPVVKSIDLTPAPDPAEPLLDFLTPIEDTPQVNVQEFVYPSATHHTQPTSPVLPTGH